MTLPITLAELSTASMVIAGVAAVLFVFFAMLAIWANRYMKVGPNQVLVILTQIGKRSSCMDIGSAARPQHWPVPLGQPPFGD